MPQKGQTLYMGQATPENKGAAALRAPTNTPAAPAADVADAQAPPKGATADQRRSPAAAAAGADGGGSAARAHASGGAPPSTPITQVGSAFAPQHGRWNPNANVGVISVIWARNSLALQRTLP